MANNKRRLTKRLVDSLAYPEEFDGNRRYVVMDDELTGFGVRVYPSGKKTFIVRYKNDERRDRLKTLGEHGPLTVAEARDLAKLTLADVIRGQDPVEDERTRRNDNLTLGELGDIFIEEWSKPRNKSWDFDRDRLDRHLRPAIGNRKASGLTTRDLSMLHRKIGKDHPFEANRVRALASSIFSYGMREGLLPPEFSNPAADVVVFDEPKRDRVISYREMPVLWHAIEDEPSPYMRAAFKLAFLTATRRGEILNIEWSDVDVHERTLYFSDTKNSRPHTVPLSPLAMRIIEELPRREGNPYVLCGRRIGRPLTTWTKRWAAIVARTDLDGIRPHDLRRTAASWIGDMGYTQLTISHLLNHKVRGVTGVYVRNVSGVPPEVRRAVDDLAAKLVELIEPDG